MAAVVALDAFDPEGSKYLHQVFPDVIEQGHPLHATWTEHAVGLFVAKSRVTREMISKAKKLRIIVRHGTGYDNIDAEACREHGVILCYCPGISAMNVAEVVLALTGACAKNLIEVSRQLRAGEKLNKKFKSLYSAALLTGKTFGIVGGGTIGQLVAKNVGAYEGNLIVYDPALPAQSWEALPHTRAASLDEILPQVDVLSIHVPLLSATRDMIAAPQLRMMKPTAVLINTARGGVVNEPDLWDALRNNIIASAGVDAWVKEPPTKEDYGHVLEMDNVVTTPHIGGSPAEIQTATCRAMVDRMKEALIDGVKPKDRVC
ncbi:hypothetical protein M409DRAFT_36894 [Zasmidium cellare ATCC 36951]|uniref:D-isomer specific 2-hydroxyacid dehydrogenase NAD-binding domain-containing protein n=1 Tax=Zasmidium cellare ATCC 36951 TaxID=1080233 RepID=A0A6A6CE09_ZASCE|nr:uncharacterized protein M409DRAFT_36894 [Zasmidium cellare ATCC 36951]KAF2165444.1 hypothetical protein M409DRAFT_36894 [Zasmidium cellare ATCC 36951]